MTAYNEQNILLNRWPKSSVRPKILQIPPDICPRGHRGIVLSGKGGQEGSVSSSDKGDDTDWYTDEGSRVVTGVSRRQKV